MTTEGKRFSLQVSPFPLENANTGRVRKQLISLHQSILDCLYAMNFFWVSKLKEPLKLVTRCDVHIRGSGISVPQHLKPVDLRAPNLRYFLALLLHKYAS